MSKVSKAKVGFWPAVSAIAGAGLVAGALGTAAVASDETTEKRLVNATQETGNWLHHHRDYTAQRYSPLNQINRSTVKGLHVAWTMALGGVEGGGIWSHGGLEGTPIVENGFIYVTDGWGSVYKIDLHGGNGKLVWKMDPRTDHDWAGAVACCGVNNRGAALWENLVISHTLDGRLVATNKDDGKVAWERKVADPDKGEVITGAPLIVKNMAITGVAGAEYGIRGWIAATNLKSQKEAWRTFTIPAKGEPGNDTWKDNRDSWKTGGGSTWVTGSYDPQANLLYWGVGNPGPDFDTEYRPGDNLYTDSTLALDPDTGTIKWHFQHTPNDPFDYDSVAERVLVDLPSKASQRKIVLEADRNGFGYALDRTDGSFLWATPFVKKVTWTKGINPETGKPIEYDPAKSVQIYDPQVTLNRKNTHVTVCPGHNGGKNWPPTAYNPDLKTWYIPVIESCDELDNKETKPSDWKAREFFTGGGPVVKQAITGSVTAIDVTTGKVTGKHETTYPMLGGLLATPELVFAGQPSGELYALDAKTLNKVWEFNTGAGINAPPMTFSVDGKQYIAILVGLGGAWDKWNLDSTKGLEKIAPGSMLYVFGL